MIDLDFLYRSLKTSLWIVALVGCWALLLGQPAWAGQYCLFGLWSTVNFYCLARLLIVAFGRKNFIRGGLWLSANALMLALFFVSCLVLYGWRILSVSAFLVGFKTPFLVILLKAVGWMMTRDNAAGIRRDAGDGENAEDALKG